MRTRLTWLALGLLLATIGAGCGDDGEKSSGAGTTGSGTGGAGGGAGGSGGAGMGGGSMTGTGGGGGNGTGGAGTGGAGSGCNYGDDCGPGLYCDAPGCGAGTCAQRPNPASLPPDETPVCGCDGESYWNESVAAWQGVPAASAGACAGGTSCTQANPCPGVLRCRREVADAAACTGNVMGTCWGMPVTCNTGGPMARGCVGGQCALKCSLVQSQNPWYADATCP